jgi:hypothetical protein
MATTGAKSTHGAKGGKHVFGSGTNEPGFTKELDEQAKHPSKETRRDMAHDEKYNRNERD